MIPRLIITIALLIVGVGSLDGSAQERVNEQIPFATGAGADSTAFDSLYKTAVQLYGNQPERAVELTSEAYEIAKLLQDSVRMVQALNLNAVSSMILGDYEQSLEIHQKALKINKEIGFDKGTINSLINIGNVHFQSRNAGESLQYYKEALELANETNSQTSKSKILNNLGSIYRTRYRNLGRKEDLDQAQLYLTEAYEIKLADRDSISILTTGTILADLAIMGGDMEKADQLLDQMEEFASQANMLEYELSVMQMRVNYYIAKKQYSNALNKALSNYEKAKELDSAFQLANSAELIAAVADSMQNYRLAYEYTQRIIAHRDNLYDENRQKIREELRLRYEVEKQELQNNLLSKEAAIQQERTKLLKDVFYFSLLGIALLTILLISQFRATKKAKRVNLELKASNELVKMQSKQLKQQTEREARINKELKNSNDFREKLLSIISHDLRSPLNAVYSATSLAAAQDLSSKEFEDLLPALIQRVKSAQDLLDNLLVWSKSQLNKNVSDIKWVNVKGMVEEIIEVASYLIEQKKLVIENLLPDEIELQVQEEALKFVLRNFIMNAIKFTPTKGRIRIAYTVSEARPVITVEDNGAGVSLVKQKSLFKKQTESESGTQGEKGNGLGLMLCNDIAKEMGAKLFVKSDGKSGSVFGLRLQRQPMKEEILIS